MLEAAITGVKYGRLYLVYSIKCKNQALTLSKESYDCYFELFSESIVEINWWKTNIAKSYTQYTINSGKDNLFRCLSKWLWGSLWKHVIRRSLVCWRKQIGYQCAGNTCCLSCITNLLQKYVWYFSPFKST